MIVVFSNYSIDECYRKVFEKDPNSTEPLHARFKEEKRVPRDVGAYIDEAGQFVHN